MSLMETEMTRHKSDDELADGAVLAENLDRLGYSKKVICTTEVAKLVAEKTGKPMSRQRIANLLNAINISPQTIEVLAKGLGVKAAELTKKPPKR